MNDLLQFLKKNITITFVDEENFPCSYCDGSFVEYSYSSRYSQNTFDTLLLKSGIKSVENIVDIMIKNGVFRLDERVIKLITS